MIQNEISIFEDSMEMTIGSMTIGAILCATMYVMLHRVFLPLGSFSFVGTGQSDQLSSVS